MLWGGCKLQRTDFWSSVQTSIYTVTGVFDIECNTRDHIDHRVSHMPFVYGYFFCVVQFLYFTRVYHRCFETPACVISYISWYYWVSTARLFWWLSWVLANHGRKKCACRRGLQAESLSAYPCLALVAGVGRYVRQGQRGFLFCKIVYSCRSQRVVGVCVCVWWFLYY